MRVQPSPRPRGPFSRMQVHRDMAWPADGHVEASDASEEYCVDGPRQTAGFSPVRQPLALWRNPAPARCAREDERQSLLCLPNWLQNPQDLFGSNFRNPFLLNVGAISASVWSIDTVFGIPPFGFNQLDIAVGTLTKRRLSLSRLLSDRVSPILNRGSTVCCLLPSLCERDRRISAQAHLATTPVSGPQEDPRLGSSRRNIKVQPSAIAMAAWLFN